MGNGESKIQEKELEVEDNSNRRKQELEQVGEEYRQRLEELRLENERQQSEMEERRQAEKRRLEHEQELVSSIFFFCFKLKLF
ncbi:hypothetical protein WR25_22012 [Diploscapter pachys]|uniref:Uncharacterized protein n=1 Tax=Diploscapter pachys TaxID=2018661 RepID=A0A2A2JR91_9BILA|nr:hypothetical protein WR25_22012 [Diploscapter pachys]